MSPVLLEKPFFTKEQIVSATTASKEFSALRKRAKKQPQYISGRNGIDSVLLDYDTYERMYGELQYFHEQEFERIAAERVAAARGEVDHKPLLLQDVLSDEELAEIDAAAEVDIPDEELFE
ncbi:MAG: hypothetical protein HFJ66_10100 [Eggerthellaceae bacterium]|nr:hypothetical protein [Eggerthellaceae bacterium]